MNSKHMTGGPSTRRTPTATSTVADDGRGSGGVGRNWVVDGAPGCDKVMDPSANRSAEVTAARSTHIPIPGIGALRAIGIGLMVAGACSIVSGVVYYAKAAPPAGRRCRRAGMRPSGAAPMSR